MPRGGARTQSGPPPDPNSRRQQTKAQRDGWLDLPSEGRQGDMPAWPLATSSDAELDYYAELWASPQAAAWESLRIPARVVANYVRYSVLAEDGDAKAATEARQCEDRLGLNPAAMLRNRWRVRVDDLAEKRETAPTEPPKRRRTLKVAGSGAVGS